MQQLNAHVFSADFHTLSMCKVSHESCMHSASNSLHHLNLPINRQQKYKRNWQALLVFGELFIMAKKLFGGLF